MRVTDLSEDGEEGAGEREGSTLTPRRSDSCAAILCRYNKQGIEGNLQRVNRQI